MRHFVLTMFQDPGLQTLCSGSFRPNHKIKSGIKQHASLISGSVCNDSVSACYNVGQAASQSAVPSVCVCVCVFCFAVIT